MIKDEIKNVIESAVKKIGSFDVPEILVEVPGDKNHGDYATNIALSLAKTLKRHPIQIADQIVANIGKQMIFSKIQVAVPGFINFYLSNNFFTENLQHILKDKNFGKNQNLKNQKIIIEYTDPNPFKEFHIGHLMSNAIGESLSRISEFQGAKVKRANYQGDVGLHVAKAIYGKIKNPKMDWPKAYAYGSKIYEEDQVAKKEIENFNKVIYERSFKDINKLYDQGKKESLEKFEKIYKVLGTHFDYYFFESQVADFGEKIVQRGLKKGVFEKGEKGAIIFKGEDFGLHTRVFINSEGLPTYEAKELGLAKIKYDKYKYEKSVIITGNEINNYFKVLLSAMSQVFPDLAKKTTHIGHGMMRLPEGKMSSRTGNVITAEFLLGEIEKLILEKLQTRDILEKEKQKIAQEVAVGAIKYSILKQSIGGDIIYDFEKSISFHGDSGAYLQYSFARAQSILRKAKTEKIKPLLNKIPDTIGEFEKIMHYFPEVVEKAGQEYEPHYIVLYLTELASAFNNYYSKNKIVDKNNSLSPYRVALVQAFSTVMKNGLWLLGISSPEKM